MTIAYYFDVHVPRAVGKALHLRGIDVLTAQEDGMGTLADDLLLLRATSLQRVLVSQDEDMLREGGKLQRDGTPFSGIVYAHQNRVTIGQLVQDLELIAAATLPEEVNNQIWHLPF